MNKVLSDDNNQPSTITLQQQQQQNLKRRLVINRLDPLATRNDIISFLGNIPVDNVTVDHRRQLAIVDLKSASEAKRVCESKDRKVLLSRQVHIDLCDITNDMKIHRNAEDVEDDRYLGAQERAELMLKMARSKYT